MTPSSSLLQALLAFQADAPVLQKDAVNPHFRNRYVSLDSLTQAITPVLCKHGLVWTTMPCVLEGQPALRYRLAHASSGEAIEDVMPLMLGKNDSQGQGSALTYARRYAVSAVLGLSAEDDDGNQAARRQQNGGQVKAATKDDVEALVAAAKGLKVGQIRMAFTACGLDSPQDLTQGFRAVPQVKAAELAKTLAGVEREPA